MANELADELRRSRKSPGVLKTKLIAIRGARPEIPVCVFEGVDDLGAYAAWFSRIDDSFKFEPIVGSGKEQIVAFAENLDGPDAYIGPSVYCFVDSDYDALQSSSPRIFVIDGYSIESALVSPAVVDRVLCEDLGCHGEPEIRDRQIQGFERRWREFDQSAADVHFQLFAARRLSLRVQEKPEKLKDFVQVSFAAVAPCAGAATVLLDRDVTLEERGVLLPEFQSLPSWRRQHGKYALQFMRKWLKCFVEHASSNTSTVGAISLPRAAANVPNAPIREFAARAPLPTKLGEFVRRMANGSRGASYTAHTAAAVKAALKPVLREIGLES